MKFFKLFILAGSISFFYSCSNSENNVNEIIVNEADIVRKNIGVKGMTCVGCEITLEKSIFNIPGVVSVKASHSAENAVIEFDSTKTDLKTIKNTIKESGYNLKY